MCSKHVGTTIGKIQALTLILEVTHGQALHYQNSRLKLGYTI